MTFDRFFTDFPLVENIFAPAVHFPSVKGNYSIPRRASLNLPRNFFSKILYSFLITVLRIYIYVGLSNIYKFSCKKIIKPADSVDPEECIFMASVVLYTLLL